MSTDTANRRYAANLQQGYEASREAIEQHPLPAALTVFGLGFGLGLALGVLMGESDRRPAWDDSGRFERYGRQFLDAIVRAVPDAVSKRMS